MSAKVVDPVGIYLQPLPAYSPELQPVSERLWNITDEPLANKSFDTIDELEEVLIERCQILSTMFSEIKAITNYHWWPNISSIDTG